MLVRRIVLGADVENDALAPLIEVLDSIQQRDDQCFVDVYAALIRQYLVDRLNCINGDQWVLILGQLIKLVQKVRLLEVALAQVEVLHAPYDRRLLDVRVNVIKTLLQRVLHILVHAVELERAQRSQGQPSYLVIRGLQIHLEGVDCQNGQLGVLLGVVNQIQVNHLLGDNVVGLRGLNHFRVESRHIYSKCHVSNDFLDYVLLLRGVLVNVDGT